MQSNIEVAGLGILEYEKIYFSVEIPRLFIGKFSEQRPKKLWLGIHVDEISDASKWSAGEGEVHDYYLVQVTTKMIKDLESGQTLLRDLFENEVLWISHRFNKATGKYATLYKKRSSINPLYKIADTATLSI